MINWKKELIDQPLHALMGAGIAGPAAYFLAPVITPWASFPLGLALSRITWMIREWWQHRKHGHEPRYWWSRDLLFIDIGILIGIGAALAIILKWV